MANKGVLWWLLAIAVPLASVATSAAEQNAAIARCGQVADDVERLACYDRVARGIGPSVAEPQPNLETETVSAPLSNATPPPRAEAPRAEATEDAQEEDEQSGGWRGWFKRDRRQAAEHEEAAADDRKERRRGRAENDEAGQAITAEIVRLKKLMRGNFQITLDNGQVWRENEYEPNTTYAVGDRVTIKSGFMGTHDLKNERTRQSARVRRQR